MKLFRLQTFNRFICLRFFLISVMVFLFLFQSLLAAVASGLNPSVDLTAMSIEELLNIEVVSASKKMQKLSETDAAVFVISQDDLKRSGVTSIPEALRMVPGIQVARIDANKWAISSRGFNGRFANKLLVLMDGRSVYTPLYSGVFWDVQDTLMEDIDRIEVIRGPGATLWGANAVNGIVNIITKKPADTQGSLIAAGGGTEERGFGAVRYGGSAGPDIRYRLYSKYIDKDGSEDITGKNGGDAWNSFRTGFRIDWRDEICLQGDVFKGDSGGKVYFATQMPPYTQLQNDSSSNTGGHLLGRWDHAVSDKSKLSLQFYYDRTDVDLLKTQTSVDTVDLELIHQYALAAHNELSWGIGYRFISDELISTDWGFDISPKKQEFQLESLFVQDVHSFLNETLRLTVGSKFEHNDFTGVEIQPSARLHWVPENTYSFWAAASRAVRTPSRAESDFKYNSVIPPGAFLPYFPGPGLSQVIGNDNLDAENIYAFELGYRVHPMEKISIDIATFYNIYNDLRNSRTQMPYIDMSSGQPLMMVQTQVNNEQQGNSYGVELAADWFLSSSWKLKAAYTFFQLQLDKPDPTGNKPPEEGTSPNHQMSLRSILNLPGHTALDIWVRYVDSLHAVDSYITADVRLGWQLTDNIDISIVGQNLLAPSHLEYGPEQPVTILTEAERSVYGKISWHF
ncbi:MAG: TonB-dependent receptor [Pseudomonadota bacterium]